MQDYFYLSSDHIAVQLVIAIPIFLTLWWLNGKLIKKRFLKLGVSLFITVFVTLLIYYVLVFIFISDLFQDQGHPDVNFYAELWQTADSIRYTMQEDLIDSEILIGKTKKEVIEMLGYPYGDSLSLNSKSVWTYYTGDELVFVTMTVYSFEIFFLHQKVDKVEVDETHF